MLTEKGREWTMPLTMANLGEPLTIQRVTGKDQVRRHLAELGLVPGGRVMVVSTMAGNLILQVQESRIALDKTLAARILI